MNFFPYINGTVSLKEGSFHLPEQLCAELGGFAPFCLNAFSARTGLPVTEDSPWLILKRDETLLREEYALTVMTDSVTVAASAEQGVILALTTLFTVLDGKTVSCFAVTDRPRNAHRGISFDTVRQFFPADEVKKLLEELSLVKMNVFHFHLADDQGWRIESERYPRLQEISKEYYTKQELRELVAFAADRGIEIIPEIDMPGHTTAVLAAYPELGCSGREVKLPDYAGIFTDILCAGRESTYEFIENILDEVVPLFPSERFHIGGDEAPRKAWKDCPDCRAAFEGLHCADWADLQGHFTCRVADMLKKRGKLPVCWSEVLNSSVRPDSMQIQYWNINERKQVASWAAEGGQVIFSDMFDLYFDYPHSMTPLKRVFSVNPKLKGKNKGIIGIECPVWCERIHDNKQLETRLFPRTYAVADRAWGGKRPVYRTFRTDLKRVCDRAAERDVCSTPESWWDPCGPESSKETLEYFAKVTQLPPGAEETTEAAPLSFAYVWCFITKFFAPREILPALKLMKGSK